MICCDPNQPDCRYLEKHEEYWVCNIYGCMPIDPPMDECFIYETEGEYALQVALQKEFDNINRTFKEFDDWRDRCIRWGVLGGVVTLIAYAIFLWSIL